MPSGPLGAVACATLMSGRSSTFGSLHGSDPLAMRLSDNRITGVMYFRAMRAASTVVSNASEGEAIATTGRGDSPCRP